VYLVYSSYFKVMPYLSLLNSNALPHTNSQFTEVAL